MGITYDELKKLQGNSVVLERQENIEIEQSANNFIRRKHTVIREKFPRQEKKRRAKEHKKSDREPAKEPLNETIARVLISSLIEGREEHTKIEEKLHVTAQNLKHLKDKIQHEIKDLKQEQSLIKMTLKPELTKKNKVQNIDKTWSENFRDNEFVKKPEEEVTVERYSQKHQCVCISPRYTSNEEVAVRPKKRTIGLQMGEPPPCCADRGAVGDRRSLNALNLKEDKAKANNLENIKDLLLKPLDPNLTKALPKNYLVNCCYGNTCCVAAQPCHASCQRYCMAQERNGVICNQQRYLESGGTPQRQYNYCRDEYYYDYPNSCQLPATATTTKICGRPCSDLNTDQFYCRKSDRTASPKTHCTSKSKRDSTAAKKNEACLKAKQNKDKKEKDKECRCMETCEEYALRKLKECEEKQKRRKERSKSRESKKSTDKKERSKSRESKKSTERQERSKSRESKNPTDRQERSKSKDPEEEKLRKEACEKILNESPSKLVELFDRYADGKDTSIGALFRYLADAKSQLSDESATTLTSCNVTCEDKGCQIPLTKKCTCPRHSRNNGLQSIDSVDDNRSRKSQFSLEALQMIKQMKLREYKPVQPPTSHKDAAKPRKSKTKSKESSKEDDEKSKRYKEYINKYSQEDEEDDEKDKEEPAKESRKLPRSTEEAPQSKSAKYPARTSKTPQNVETDDEEVIERYAYGPAVGNGWDDYGRSEYDDDTNHISQNQDVMPKMERQSIDYGHREKGNKGDLRSNNGKSKRYSEKTSRALDDWMRQSDNEDSQYNSPEPRDRDLKDERDRDFDAGRQRVDRSDNDKGAKSEDERVARRQRERNKDQTPGSPRYFDEDSFSANDRRNRYQKPSTSRGGNAAYDNRNQTKPSNKYEDETLENLRKPVGNERGNRYQNPSTSGGSNETYDNRNQPKPASNYRNEPSQNLRKPSPNERGNRPSSARGTYEVKPNQPSSEYQDEPSQNLRKPVKTERGNRYQNPAASGGSNETYENPNQAKPACKYRDETSENLRKPVKTERGNRYQNPSASGGSNETYENPNQPQDLRKPVKTERGRGSPSRGSYDAFDNRNQTKPSTKYEDESIENLRNPVKTERGQRYQTPSPSRGSYDASDNRYQIKPSTKYEDEPVKTERGQRYQTPSPSRGSYDASDNRYQTSSKYQDESPVNFQKPGQSEYDYPIKQQDLQSQGVEHETQRSQRQQQRRRQDENVVRTQQEESGYQNDGSRRNDALSKSELTDQESFRTYTKSAEIPKAEQGREDESRDRRLVEGFTGAAPTSKSGYSKYQQNIQTKYTQDDDGTEVTRINEEITIDETYGQSTNNVPATTEEAIRYLKGFLNSYEKYGFEEDCLKSVSNVTNDLINKLSTCTTVLKTHSATTTTEQPTSETQYKDLESTSNASPIKIKQETQERKREEAQSYLPPLQTSTQNEMGNANRHNYSYGSHSPKTNSPLKNMADHPVPDNYSYGSHSPKTNSPLKNVADHPVRQQERISNSTTSPKDNGNYSCETIENYRFCERQTQSDLWETEENYENLKECREDLQQRLHPPEEFTDAQYDQQQSPNCDPNQYMDAICPPPPMINASNNNECYSLPEYRQSKYNNTPRPCYSRVSQKSCCCNTSNTGTSSGSLEEASPGDAENLPIKGILKPCRVKDASASTVCDFESNKTISCVSFGNEEKIKTHKATSRMYTLGPEKISKINDENIDTLITKDESQRPLRKQSTITRCETTVKQPILDDCNQFNYNHQPCIDDAQPLQHCQSAQENLGETIPRFTHCPCMLDTYLKLLEIYCKEEDKFDFIKR